mgnify:CR=1 FL=1
MAFLEKIIRKDEEIDIEEFLNNLDESDENIYDDAEAFVKPMDLSGNEDIEGIMKEIKQGNIILLNVESLSKRNVIKLKELITKIKDGIDEVDGDIARISAEKVLITPSKVKIIKKKEAQ